MGSMPIQAVKSLEADSGDTDIRWHKQCMGTYVQGSAMLDAGGEGVQGLGSLHPVSARCRISGKVQEVLQPPLHAQQLPAPEEVSGALQASAAADFR